MIEGLTVAVRGAEIVERLSARIAHHQERVRTCERRLAQAAGEADDPEDDQGDAIFVGPQPGSPRRRIERRLRGHQERILTLAFMRDHLVPDEVYRLSEGDLASLEIIPSHGGW